ncbi:MAG: hypothetical protein H6Q36_1300 [Chloroflexi bacterium]|nr:hypothetical protein [Chloroflexota bacterium]
MDPRPNPRHRAVHLRHLVLLAAASTLLLAACGGTATRLDGVGGPVPAPSAAAAFRDYANTEVPAAEGGGATAPDGDLLKGDRLIVRTGTLSIQVTELDAALSEVARGIEVLGGYVAASERSGQDETASARITYRIPAARWEDALVVARKAGAKVLAEQTSSTEVTDQVVDLGARLVNLRATETALQEIMQRATKIPDILEVQGQLTSVREQIERLEAEKLRLEGQAAMATLAVEFTLPPPVAVTTVQQGWDPASEIDRAAATLVEMGQEAVNVGIWLVVVWLPVLLIVGLVALVGFAVVRLARRHARTSPPPSTGEPGPDLPATAAS